ncbi:site-specific integrase [Marinobacter sp. bablab_jr008]|uniref:site-specific integrase n=1 Tax=Marinobacter sp. bablab_jr008 TaxID=2755064 RepID=UPI002B1BD1DF|nr:site-specific integrase [Marinobacter sp. bablab_jr008]
MYLERSSFSTYYTRVALPHKWRAAGFPHSVKISLRTKDRKTAIKRNLRVSSALVELFDSDSTFESLSTFQNAVARARQSLEELSLNKPVSLAFAPADVQNPASPPKRSSKAPVAVKRYKDAGALAKDFVSFKKRSRVTASYQRQLKTRLVPLVAFVGDRNVRYLKPTDAIDYQEELLERDWSPKTVKEYLAVASQFLGWCKRMKYASDNPFESIRLIETDSRAAHEQRSVWTSEQLSELFSHKSFSARGSAEDQWLPLLLLYSGLRPSEACQLRVSDVKYSAQHELWFIDITDQGPQQRLKTASAKREVPLHPELIDLGFLGYLKQQKRLKRAQLFRCTPTGKNNDWSRNFTQRFNRFLSKRLGWDSKGRPTAYSFRHTIANELKQAGIDERIAAEILGHSTTGITFTRYGKPSSLATKLKQMSKISFAQSTQQCKKYFL